LRIAELGPLLLNLRLETVVETFFHNLRNR